MSAMPNATNVFAVIDTNVIVSALFSKDGTSYPAKIVQSMLDGVIVPLFNQEIISEYRDVLSRPKFPFSDLQISTLLYAIQEFGLDTKRTKVADEIFPDIDDIVFYEVKMSIDEAFLVTGNIRHFPDKPFIVTPAEMVQILSEIGLI